MNSPRPNWPETWMAVAEILARRATCPRLQVGAVAVTADNQVLASGFNGSPRGLPHCSDVGCLMDDMELASGQIIPGNHCIRAVHAESNVILQAARLGITLQGCTLYTTVFPCPRCALQIVQAGIEYVHYAAKYRATADYDRALRTLHGGGVRVIRGRD